MGGFMAASAAAHNPKVAAAVLISAWNIGAPRPSEADEAKALASDDNLAPAIAPRPVLLVTASDGSGQFAAPMAAALKAAGDTHVTTEHFDTDHPYSNKRGELIDAVKSFLKQC